MFYGLMRLLLPREGSRVVGLPGAPPGRLEGDLFGVFSLYLYRLSARADIRTYLSGCTPFSVIYAVFFDWGAIRFQDFVGVYAQDHLISCVLF